MLTVTSFAFNPLAENTYVLTAASGECIIIDPGCYFDYERAELANFITGHQLQPKYLLNTHCHLDHVFGNKFVNETWKLEPWIHAGEQLILEAAPMAGVQWGVPFDNYTGPLHFLREKEVIRLGEDILNVLFTPGHSPGHLSFYAPVDKFVIAGDALFRMSIGRTDLPGGDYETLIASIGTQLLTLPEETIVYSGHGPQTSIGYEKKHNPFLQDN